MARRIQSRFIIAALIVVMVTMAVSLSGVSTSYAQGSPETAEKNKPRNGQADLLAKAKANGTVRVIATLRIAYQPEGQLSPVDVQAQRAAVQAATNRLIASLQGQNYSVTQTFQVYPFVGLIVDTAALQALFASPDVASVAESTLKHPNDVSSGIVIGLGPTHAAGWTGNGYTVTVLDTGFQTSHPYLAGKTLAEACFSRTVAADSAVTLCPNGLSTTAGGAPGQTGAGAAANCSSAIDGCEHGTHVAGIAVGKDYVGGPGYNGVAPDSKLIAVQVFSKFTTTGACGGPAPCVSAYDEDILAGLQYVQTTLQPTYSATTPIVSVNMSLGDGVNNTSACDASPYFTAVAGLRTLNIATAIAAGNEGYTNGLSGPGCVSNSISTGATTDADAIASFSNRASFMALFAPGVAIDSSVPTSAFDNLSGTSMATPHVAGAWAVMRQRYPGETVTQILTRLQNTGKPIVFGANTKKRIQLDAATGSPTATPTNTSPPPSPTSTVQGPTYMIQDGSLEAGFVSTYWTQTSTNFGTPVCNASCGGVGPRTGTYWAWFGGTSAAETGSLTQTKLIASGAKLLTFYVWWSSSVGSPPDPNAYFRAKMDGNIIFSLTPATAGPYNSGYTYASVNISAYANNASHTLVFEQGNVASSGATNVHLDDINFASVPGATATPTSTATATRTPTATATSTASSTPPAPRPDTVGAYRTSNTTFYLRNTNSAGAPDITASVQFATANDLPVTGDWNGDGIDTVGLYRTTTGFFYLWDTNANQSMATPVYTVLLGNPGDTPFAGRWTADMNHDGLGVYRNSNGILYMRKLLTGGFSDFAAVMGNPGDAGFAGDWDSNGFDSPGVFRPSNTMFYLSNNSTPNGITFSDVNFVYGAAADLPFAGDWIAQGHSSAGVFRGSTGIFYLRNPLSAGAPNNTFAYGAPGDKPVAGKWIAGPLPPNAFGVVGPPPAGTEPPSGSGD